MAVSGDDTRTRFFAVPRRVFGSAPRDDVFAEIAAALRGWAETQADPFALAGCQIFVPNRRAARTLLQRFAETGTVGLAPVVRVLGDLETETLEGLGQNEYGDATLDPSIAEAERIGLLAALARPFLKANEESHRQSNPVQLPPTSTNTYVSPRACLAAGRDLAALLDQAAMAGLTEWPDFESLIENTDLAGHWQTSAAFLSLLSSFWPAILADRKRMDPGQRRIALIDASIAAWRADPPQHPVFVVGSTGSAKWVRGLMAAVLELPRGVVILPGIAPAKADASWAAVEQAPGHPLYSLARTLRDLGVLIEHLHPLRAEDHGPTLSQEEARRRFVLEALAPPKITSDWRSRLDSLALPLGTTAFAERALLGLTRIDTEDEFDEARVAAILLRQTLLEPGKTACVVTPSPSSALRVSLMLQRFGITLQPSAGRSVAQAPLGRLTLAVAELLLNPRDPVALLTVLKTSPALGYRGNDVAMWDLERSFLRGPIRWANLQDLAEKVHEKLSDVSAGVKRLAEWISDVRPAASPADPLVRPLLSAQAHAQTLSLMLSRLAAEPDDPEAAWRGEVGQRIAKAFEEIALCLEPLGPVSFEDVLDELLRVLNSSNLPPLPGDQPRLAILGPLEARLQRCDRVILVGLNEGVWPAAAGPDPFLSRALKQKLGLPDPDERLGLAAHDFAMLLGAPEVFLLRAGRVDNTPTVASRWLWRLDALAQAAGMRLPRQQDLPEIARVLDPVPELCPAQRPEPRPPVNARPTRFSVSKLGTLMRDPYAFYANQVLHLNEVDPVGLEFDARHTGLALHRVMEKLEKPAAIEGLTAQSLAGMFRQALAKDGLPEETLTLWQERLNRIAVIALDWLKARPAQADVFTELKTEWVLRDRLDSLVIPRPLTFVTMADRIELSAKGLSVIDFKTGATPTSAQMVSAKEPQIGFMAAMAQRGAFPGVRASPLFEASAVKLRINAKHEFLKVPQKQDPDGTRTPAVLAEAVLKGTLAAVLAFEHEAKGYLSRKMMLRMTDEGNFDRLARLEEWAGEDAPFDESAEEAEKNEGETEDAETVQSDDDWERGE